MAYFNHRQDSKNKKKYIKIKKKKITFKEKTSAERSDIANITVYQRIAETLNFTIQILWLYLWYDRGVLHLPNEYVVPCTHTIHNVELFTKATKLI